MWKLNKMMRYLIVSEELGVYLGSAMGMGFWSKLDHLDLPVAVTFESEDQGLDFAETWDSPVEDIDFLPVEADKEEYASEEACVAAGVSPWLTGTYY